MGGGRSHGCFDAGDEGQDAMNFRSETSKKEDINVVRSIKSRGRQMRRGGQELLDLKALSKRHI